MYAAMAVTAIPARIHIKDDELLLPAPCVCEFPLPIAAVSAVVVDAVDVLDAFGAVVALAS